MKESIGQQLRQTREARKMSLEQVARATHIRVHYLQALEADNFSAVPSAAQARGFLRAYTAHLGLNPDQLLATLDEPSSVQEVPEVGLPEPIQEGRLPEDQEWEVIFAEIGTRLKHQRELLGLSLEDVERHTHLRQHYLSALEAGDLPRLPSPVQGRGMLNNYANFLGLDAEPLLLRFAQGLQAQLAARQVAHPDSNRRMPKEPKPPSTARRIFSGESLLAVFIVLSLVAFVIWGAVRIFEMQSEEAPAPAAPSIAEVLLSPATATATPTFIPSSPLAPLPPQSTLQPESTEAIAVLPGGEQGLQVYITVRQRAWMRVSVDGEVVFDGRVLPGTAYQFEGQEVVDVLTGNGAALQVFFNQQDQGPMGLFGEVVQRVYTMEGIQTPTPTTTQTPTETSRPTATPRGAGTPTP